MELSELLKARKQEKLEIKKRKQRAKRRVWEKKRVKRMHSRGLVKCYGYYIHKSRKTEVLYKINLLMHSDDYTQPSDTFTEDFDSQTFKIYRDRGANDAF